MNAYRFLAIALKRPNIIIGNITGEGFVNELDIEYNILSF
jgi:hypothetical protein